MKLTKGKLSKLFHNKKQTMRRYKNQRKYRRASKTFRQRKPLNLHRSSMKKMVVPRKLEWIGGTEPDEKVPLVVKPASDEATTESIMEPVPEPVAEEPVSEPAMEPVPEPVTEQAVEPVPESIPEQAVEPVPELIPEPVAEEPVPEPIPEPVAEQPVPEPIPEPVPEPASTTPSVADALNIIADKIATAVVMKMRENPATGSTSNQDADIAVPLAVSAVVKQTQLAPE